MMATKPGSPLSHVSALMLAFVLLASPVAFGQSSKPAKPPSSAKQTQKTPAAKIGAKSGETTCDGALEIVPSQPMTFARKRRPKSVTSQSSS